MKIFRKSQGSYLVRGVMLFVMLFTLAGCFTLLSNYNATSYEHLTSLKAYHVKFLEDFTEGKDRTYDEGAVKSVAEKGDLKFREAKEYASNIGDEKRTQNIVYLYEVFTDEVSYLIEDKALFSKEYVRGELDLINRGYGKAIEAEKARPE